MKKSTFTLVKSKKGFTLVSVLVAGAVGIILLLGISQFSLNSLRNIRGNEFKLRFTSIEKEVNSVFQNLSTCSEALRAADDGPGILGGPGDIVAVTRNFGGNRVDIIREGSNFGGGYSISQIKVDPILDSSGTPVVFNDTPSPGLATHWINLIFEANATQVSGLHQLTNAGLPIKLGLVVDSVTGRIQRCTESSGSDGSLDFQWILETNPCPLDYIDTGMRDDSDTNHAIGEDSFSGATLKLCASGVESVSWSGVCPAGYFDTGILDDSDANHHLSEDSITGPTVHWCIKGISAGEWHYTPKCRRGWSTTTILGISSDTHLASDKNNTLQIYCVRK